MRALRFLSLRLRLLVATVTLALSIPGPVWSAIDFSNGLNATLTGDVSTGTLSGTFFQSLPFPLTSSTADLGAGTATWIDPVGDEIHLTFVGDGGVFLNDFLQKFTGTFDIVGGTGKFLDNTGGGSFEAFFFYSAPGTVAQVTAINVGTIIPEPAVWLMLAVGFGLLGFMRIRRAAQTAI